MEAKDLIAVRRSIIRDSNPRRIVPTGTLYVSVSLGPIEEHLEQLNTPGRLPPGLRAEVDHLVIRAAARALADHPHFNDLMLPGGAVHESDQVHVRISLDGPGSALTALLSDPGGRPLDELVSAADSREVETRSTIETSIRKKIRRLRTRPVWDRVYNDVLASSLCWLRDRVRLPQGWIRIAVDQTGNFTIHPLSRLGFTSVSGPLTGARVGEVLICSPFLRSVPDPSGGFDRVLRVGLSYDMRLFEAHEAAAYLRDVARLLEAPLERLA